MLPPAQSPAGEPPRLSGDNGVLAYSDFDDDGYFSRLAGRVKPGRSLDREFYTSARVFERDLARVYFRQWLFVAHASRLPKPGDYFLYQVGGESIILIRTAKGSIEALLNVCPHRGSRICLEETGCTAKWVCPYHAWCFDQDGTFRSARHLPPGLNLAELGLRRFHVQVVEDLVFVCLAPSPPDFSPVAEDLRRFFAPHGFPRAKICARTQISLRANWKIAAENFYECARAPRHRVGGDVARG